MVDSDMMLSLDLNELISLVEGLSGVPPPSPPSSLEPVSVQPRVASDGVIVERNSVLDPARFRIRLPADCGASRMSLNRRVVNETASIVEDEARKFRRMARNRRAAANSRAKKKIQLDAMQDEVNKLLDANKRLQVENAVFRRCLCDAGVAIPTNV